MAKDNIDNNPPQHTVTDRFVTDQIQALMASGQLTNYDQMIFAEPSFESTEKLQQAFAELSPDDRELLMLFQTHSCAEIAKRKQRPLSSIRESLSGLYASLRLQVDFN